MTMHLISGDGRVFRFLRIVTAALLAALLVTSQSSAQSIDEVTLVPNATIKAAGGIVRGTIQTESANEVVVVLGATRTPVPVDQVSAIRYGGRPQDLNLAEIRESGGDFAEAVDLYQKAESQ